MTVNDCLMTLWWLSDDCLMTVQCLSNDCPMTVQWLSADYQLTVQWLFNDCPIIVQWVCNDCLIIDLWLSTTFWWRLFPLKRFPLLFGKHELHWIIRTYKSNKFEQVQTWFKKNHFCNFYPRPQQQQSGAVEACWAHNPEVRRSKLRSARKLFFNSIQETNFNLKWNLIRPSC